MDIASSAARLTLPAALGGVGPLSIRADGVVCDGHACSVAVVDQYASLLRVWWATPPSALLACELCHELCLTGSRKQRNCRRRPITPRSKMPAACTGTLRPLDIVTRTPRPRARTVKL